MTTESRRLCPTSTSGHAVAGFGLGKVGSSAKANRYSPLNGGAEERQESVGIGVSIVVFAIGAILRFATTVQSSNFNIHTIGVILMVVGAVGFVVSLIFWASWGGFGGVRRRRTVYRDGSGNVIQDRQDTSL
jgi:hypothetical protein